MTEFLILLSLLAGCIHAPPEVQPVDTGQTMTDAADQTDLRHWRDLRIEYFRSGELIYMEWGKVFITPDGNGRILILSPEGDRIDPRSYRFQTDTGSLLDDGILVDLLDPALLKGWSAHQVIRETTALLVVQAYPSMLDRGEIDGEFDPLLFEFFWDIFFTFLDIFIEITLS